MGGLFSKPSTPPPPPPPEPVKPKPVVPVADESALDKARRRRVARERNRGGVQSTVLNSGSSGETLGG